MKINSLNKGCKSPTEKIQELTIYHHYLANNNSNDNISNSIMSTKNQTAKDMNDLSDDDYILELHKKLAKKREIRKISEQGVKILNGRVLCLKDENKKTLGKIDLTKKN